MNEQAPTPKISVPPLLARRLGFSTTIIQGPGASFLLCTGSELHSFDAASAFLASQGARQDSVFRPPAGQASSAALVPGSGPGRTGPSWNPVPAAPLPSPEPQFLSLHEDTSLCQALCFNFFLLVSSGSRDCHLTERRGRHRGTRRNATQGSSSSRPGFVPSPRSQPLFSRALVECCACQWHPSRARLQASLPFQKHGSFCLFLQAFTSSPSPGLQACADSRPHWAATQRNFPELTLLFPECTASGRRSVAGPLTRQAALPCSRAAPAVTQPQLTPAVFSSPGSLRRLPLPLSSLPPTRLPHPALGALSLAPRSLSGYCSPLPALAFSRPTFAF